MESQLDLITVTTVELVSVWGLRVVGAIVLLVLGLVVARLLRSASERAFRRSRLDANLAPYFSGIVYYLALAFLAIAVLQLFGIETTSMVAVLGAVGFAIGLALQGTLANFSSGVMLLIFRPFRSGDFIDVAGSSGKVVEIGIFSTSLNTPDNIRIIVPNSAIYGQTIRNLSTNPIRRNDIVVGISYSDDIGVALQTLESLLAEDSRVLEEPPPQVFVKELGESSVDLVARPWCSKDDYWPLRFDLHRRFKEELENAGCSIPFPQRDIHLLSSGSPQPQGTVG